MRFTALLHHVTPELLRASYFELKRKAAPGVDGMTWHEYGQDLEERLDDLHGRMHRGAYGHSPPSEHGFRRPTDASVPWALLPWRTRSSSRP